MKGIVYVIFDGSFYKIGYTKKKTLKRLNSLNTANSSNLSIVFEYSCNHISCSQLEALLHRKFHRKNIKGEWFDLSSDDIKELKILCETSDKNIEIFKSFSDEM